MALLGLSWELLGLSWELLGLSWELLGLSWELLGLSWGLLEPSGASLGASWSLSWGLLEPLGEALGACWNRLKDRRPFLSQDSQKTRQNRLFFNDFTPLTKTFLSMEREARETDRVSFFLRNGAFGAGGTVSLKQKKSSLIRPEIAYQTS